MEKYNIGNVWPSHKWWKTNWSIKVQVKCDRWPKLLGQLDQSTSNDLFMEFMQALIFFFLLFAFCFSVDWNSSLFWIAGTVTWTWWPSGKSSRSLTRWSDYMRQSLLRLYHHTIVHFKHTHPKGADQGICLVPWEFCIFLVNEHIIADGIYIYIYANEQQIKHHRYCHPSDHKRQKFTKYWDNFLACLRHLQ